MWTDKNLQAGESVGSSSWELGDRTDFSDVVGKPYTFYYTLLPPPFSVGINDWPIEIQYQRETRDATDGSYRSNGVKKDSEAGERSRGW